MDPESYGIELESAYFSEEDIAANQSPSPPFSPARRIEETEVDVAIIGESSFNNFKAACTLSEPAWFKLLFHILHR